jgi:hypothetical protein
MKFRRESVIKGLELIGFEVKQLTSGARYLKLETEKYNRLKTNDAQVLSN